MKNTTMRGASYGFAALLVVLVVVGTYVIGNIHAARESLKETAEAGGEEGLAASEMRTRVGKIGDATLDYVETDDSGYLRKPKKARAASKRQGPGTANWSAKMRGGEVRSTPSTGSTRL